jgi:hypothetical protein
MCSRYDTVRRRWKVLAEADGFAKMSFWKAGVFSKAALNQKGVTFEKGVASSKHGTEPIRNSFATLACMDRPNTSSGFRLLRMCLGVQPLWLAHWQYL